MCYSLKSITIPDSVTRIGDCAFEGCISLESITIPDSVTSIGDYAFECCSSLESITIPDSVTSIGSGAFYACNNCTAWCEVATKPSGWSSLDCDVIYGASSSDYEAWDGFSKALTGKEKDIVIPDGIKGIPKKAFYGYSSLASITIPDSVTSIGYDAFRECSKLTGIEIPDGVRKIGKRAFGGCDSLTHLLAPIELLETTYLKLLATLTALKCKEDRPLNDDVLQYAFRNKKKIITMALEQDDDQSVAFYVAFYLENKKLKKRDITSTYLKAADDAKAVKCAALLLEFANGVGSNRRPGSKLEL